MYDIGFILKRAAGRVGFYFGGLTAAAVSLVTGAQRREDGDGSPPTFARSKAE